MWVSKSTRHLAKCLEGQGFSVSRSLVGRLLGKLGYTLQANAKTLEGGAHPARDRQFGHINEQVAAFLAAGEPVISPELFTSVLCIDRRARDRPG